LAANTRDASLSDRPWRADAGCVERRGGCSRQDETRRFTTMSELRQNLATKDWVIIAQERAQRPQEFIDPTRRRTDELPDRLATCPFCPGNEDQTVGETLRWPSQGPWQLRVFSNRYPALRPDAGHQRCLSGLKRHVSGIGYHEVLVETPRHNICPALQSPEEIHLTLKALQQRGRRMLRDSHVEHVIYYKNHGPAAGTSISHPHCQLLGLPMIPQDTRLRIEEARRSVDDYGACPHCTMLEMELKDRQRLVAENPLFAAFVLYAAYSPFHIWVLPRLHRPSFLAVGDNELDSLARLLREVFGKLYYGLSDPDFNYLIRSAPLRDIESDYLHWYLSIVPRVTKAAGFELGSGMYINPALPEESAAFLRDTDPGQPLTSLPPEVAREALADPGVASGR
jgi:UDPglucose--hexose-1-phosphate uridylyltransferase